MFPLSDINPTHRFPIATIGLIGINVAVYFLFQATLNEREAYLLAANWAAVPAEISRGIGPEQTLDIFRAMFMHGSLTHLLGNMLYLWIFGDNLEDRLGIPLYLAFYFACGIAATLAQVMVDPASQIPMLGASGAIAGVLGGYLIMFPGVRVRGLVILGFFVQVAEVPAIVVLGLWFVLQVVNGLGAAGMLAGGGVAWFAHIGGFLAGVVLIVILMRIVPQPAVPQRREWLYDRYDRTRGRGAWW